MLDGAALGTLIIGLDSVREASEWPASSVRVPARRSRRPSAVRVRLANVLRTAADRFDRPAAAELESSSSAA